MPAMHMLVSAQSLQHFETPFFPVSVSITNLS